MKQELINPARITTRLQKQSKLLIAASMVSILLCLISAQARGGSDQPTGFQFYFGGPGAGMRVWKRTGDIWTEKYSNGQKDTFRARKDPYKLRGIKGTLVEKVADPGFFVFIPDVDSEKMDVWIYKDKGPWRFLAQMKEVEPVHNIY